MTQGFQKPVKRKAHNAVQVMTKRKNIPKPRKHFGTGSNPVLQQQAKKLQVLNRELTTFINRNIEETMLARAVAGNGTKLCILKNNGSDQSRKNKKKTLI
jgi:UDP-N-acetylenolpyruvoylglucosamine reductase